LSNRNRKQKFSKAADPSTDGYNQENELFNFRGLPYSCDVARIDKIICGTVSRKTAVRDYPYFQINQKSSIYHLVLDLDCENAVLDWYDSDISFLPSFFVGKVKDGKLIRPHAVIKLEIPVKTDSRKQMRFLQVIKNAIFQKLIDEAGSLKGYEDRKMPRQIKNPNCKKNWKTIVGDPRTWTLSELRDELELPKSEELTDADRLISSNSATYFDEEDAALGRNCNIFNRVKGAAYAYKKLAINEEDLYQFTYNTCLEIDAEESAIPLPISEIRSIAKSVSSWTWHKYDGAGLNDRDIDIGACRRAMLINSEMPLKQKQTIGGRYGASQNSIKTFERVKEIFETLKSENRQMSDRSISKEFKISRNTISKYKDLALAELEKSVGIPLKEFTDSLKNMGIRERLKTVYQESGPLEILNAERIMAYRDKELWEFRRSKTDPTMLIDKDNVQISEDMVKPYVISNDQFSIDDEIPF
jgi:hypothetical protein